MATTNEDLVRRFTDQVWNQHNLSTVEDLVADDAVMHDLTRDEEYVGPENVKNFARLYIAALPDATVEIDDILVDGDTVVTRWTMTGTHQGDLFGVPATGNAISVPGITIDTVDDGEIVEQWTLLSLFSLLQQIDAGPELM